MAKIVLATFGSLGDLHPFMALALRLRDAGHDTVVAGMEEYRSKVEAEGLEFASVRPSLTEIGRDMGLDAKAAMARIVARDDVIFRELIFPYVRQAFEDNRRALEGADLLVSSNFAYGARIAAELRGVASVTAVLQPAGFLSVFDPPMGPRPVGNRIMAALSPAARAGLKGLVKALVNRWGAPLHALRHELGLPPMRDVVFDGQFAGARRALGLYSPLLGKVQPDFPPGSRVTGFCVYDSEHGGGRAPTPELERFLANGRPPIVVSLGSTAVLVGESVYRHSLAAARALGERAVLLVGVDALDRWRSETGPDVFVSSYEPHSALFPRAAVVIHHGGAGTTGQALRAGVPQLIAPFMADQPDNAARVVRLGAARTLPHDRFTAERAAPHLQTLLREPAYAEAARRAAVAIAAEDGPGAAAAAIEDVLRETQPS